MKLYYTPSACSLVPRIIINELGLQPEFVSVNLMTKETQTGNDFFSINPKGAVPTLELDNGEILTENAVILQYLADFSKATQLLPPISDFKRYQTLEWLNYIATELHKGIGVLFNPLITEEMKETIFFPQINKKLTYVNNHLQDRTYLLGKDFTLPDAYLFVMLRWATYFKLDLKLWTHLDRYFKTLHDRPSIQCSLEQEQK